MVFVFVSNLAVHHNQTWWHVSCEDKGVKIFLPKIHPNPTLLFSHHTRSTPHSWFLHGFRTGALGSCGQEAIYIIVSYIVKFKIGGPKPSMNKDPPHCNVHISGRDEQILQKLVRLVIVSRIYIHRPQTFYYSCRN